ncbi:MAG TPA: PASTA domain-containing protein [Chitinophagaceae bacterium]|nr:PASTA domain-containing protein [Chitinophagaceae bacterium]
MFKFITNRPLWVNILVGILLAVGFFALVLFSLKWITHHGRSAVVPSVAGKSFEEAKKILKEKSFAIEIQDSVYVDTAKPMTVLKQFPEPDELVKRNRTVFLVINRAIPPMIAMPNLVGFSYRNAEMVLSNIGLKIGDTLSKPDFAKNAVLEQLYNGHSIKPGSEIRMGSAITLVLGDGVGNREFKVPVIIGMQFAAAKDVLEANGIVIGAVVADMNVTDTLHAWIYKQNPTRFDEDKHLQKIRSGQTIDVWLQQDKPVQDSTKTNIE